MAILFQIPNKRSLYKLKRYLSVCGISLTTGASVLAENIPTNLHHSSVQHAKTRGKKIVYFYCLTLSSDD